MTVAGADDATTDVDEEGWVDEAAGPVVRPYAVTHGRTRPARGDFDLLTQVTALHPPGESEDARQPEHAAILRLCQNPLSVAEVATQLDLPVGSVRVLLGDLLDRGLIRTRSPVPAAHPPTDHVFKAVLDGLRAL
jgi:uncharacterized protein DUF742